MPDTPPHGNPLPKSTAMILAAAAVAGIAVADVITGKRINLSSLYVIPMVVAAAAVHRKLMWVVTAVAVLSLALGIGAVVLRVAVLPQILPQCVAYVQYILERNVRTATILGVASAGGIGFELMARFNNSEYDAVATILIIIFVSVTDPRSWPTSPAEWKVEPEVSSARSTRTTSLQPSSVRW